MHQHSCLCTKIPPTFETLTRHAQAAKNGWRITITLLSLLHRFTSHRDAKEATPYPCINPVANTVRRRPAASEKNGIGVFFLASFPSLGYCVL